jgi:hypothetical protein
MNGEHRDMESTTTMSSSPAKSLERRRVDVSRLSSILRHNAPATVGFGYRNRPVVDMLGYVEPTLADCAHCAWEDEGNHAKIYLGPALSAGAKAYESLVAANVGAILNCTPHIPCHHRRHHNTMRYLQVPVRDHAGADILTYLPEATSFLDTHLRQGTSVLVHCEMGVSRSATVVLAYLMRYHNRTRDESYILLKQRRPSMDPNEGFWQQLLLWQHRTTAARMDTTRTAAATSTSIIGTGTIAKTATSQEPEPVDRDWAEQSSTLYSTCWEIVMEGADRDLFHACFDRCISANALDRNHIHTLEVCLDFVWGRGVSAADVDWLTALCRFLAEMDNTNGNINDNDGSMARVSVQRQVLAIIEDTDSNFGSQWSGEIYLKQMERIRQALGL